MFFKVLMLTNCALNKSDQCTLSHLQQLRLLSKLYQVEVLSRCHYTPPPPPGRGLSPSADSEPSFKSEF